MKASTWTPICQGDLALRVRRTVRHIALDIDPSTDLPESLLQEMTGPSLAVGRGGAVLLTSVLAAENAFSEIGEEQAAERLEALLESAGNTSLPPNLYGGVAGIAWLLEHLGSRLFDTDGQDLNEDTDRLLTAHLSKVPWIEDYDLVSGLVGLGVYGLERLPRPSGVELVGRVVDHLDAWAETAGGGVTWLSRPHLLWEETAALFPRGCYNLGLAHGVPGVIAFLAQVCAAGDCLRDRVGDRARKMLDGAVPWLAAQRLPPDSGSAFTDMIGPDPTDQTPKPSRLAWCYGDAGVATALLAAAQAGDRRDWRDLALDIARRAALRSKEDARVKDAGLCHGSAGLAHLFNRMYQATGDPILKEAALRWVEETLAMGDASKAGAGYVSWEPESPGGEFFSVPRTSLVTGTAGIGLALWATISRQEPLWDRVLLASLTPRSEASVAGRRQTQTSLLRTEP